MIEDTKGGLTVLYLRYNSGRSDLYAPPSPHDLCEGVVKSLFGIGLRSLKCAFEDPGMLRQRQRENFVQLNKTCLANQQRISHMRLRLRMALEPVLVSTLLFANLYVPQC